jgi:hypothetical protein
MVDNTRIFGFEVQRIFQGSPVELNLLVREKPRELRQPS